MADTKNPFAVDKSADMNHGAVAIEKSRAMMEVQAAFIMAREYPRNRARCFDQAMLECGRIELADAAMYSYPRGGETVSGPSIRLMEALVRCWTNMKAGQMELSQGPGYTEMMAYCTDYESNTTFEKRFRVEHIREKKGGNKSLTDPRDIYELTANMGARRMRACMEASLPGELIEAALQKCNQTILAAKQAEKPDQRIDKLIQAFASIEIPIKHIEARAKKEVSKFTPDDFVEYGKIFNSLKAAQSSPWQWFEGFKKPESSIDPNERQLILEQIKNAPNLHVLMKLHSDLGPKVHAEAWYNEAFDLKELEVKNG